ncbi:hypothetical protein ASG35_03030 [Burkholderia sp. Leaf177]|uniref:hypothetical protein n=1 Tax=Burkholderia sp. Leaf177 TaxID=1736287 RepID=UPI0006F2EE1C|nr:hypothetical protein [Burkholderia sp. Leaf177]KQR90199.1 hypothetical protein ASG35_03030 [Burkholderia sp. Leaf177]
MSDEIQSSGPDLNAIADRLYGTPATAPAEPAQVAAKTKPASEPVEAKPADPRALRRQAEDIERAARAKQATSDADKALAEKYPNVPAEVAKLRDTSERRMFSPQGTFASVQLEAAMKDVTIDPAIKTAVAAEYREVFADIGASAQDAQEIVDAVGRFTAEPMTPERDAKNANSAIQMLTEHYGADAKAALASAVEMVTRDPRFARVLEVSRLGNDPQTVLKLCQLARSQKARGG